MPLTAFPHRRSTHRLQRRPLGHYRYVRLRWRILFAIIDFLGGWIFKRVRRKPSGKTGDPRVILLVQLDHLGDAVLSIGFVAALHERWPTATIEALASPSNQEIFAALPEVGRVYRCGANRFARGRLARLGWILGMVWWGLRLRLRGVDLGIDVRGEFPLALLLWLSGAHTRLGWASGGGGFLLTHSPQYINGRPEVDSRRALLAELGITGAGRVDFCRPRFAPPADDRRRIAQRLAQTDARPAGPLVVLHLGAGTQAKRWPAEHWRALLRRLRTEHDARVILVGGANERVTAQSVRGLRGEAAVEDWTGQITLGELAALLEQADLLIGADSGPAHLAAAVGTPVVALFSGTNRAQQWAPSGRNVCVVLHPVACSPCHRQHCPLPDHPCMAGLTPQRVSAAVTQSLSMKIPRRALAAVNPA